VEAYRRVFDHVDEGFCIVEVLFDEHDKPVDYRFVEVNHAFEKQTGLRNAVGKRIGELVPNHEIFWSETYGKVATTGHPVRFQNFARELGIWFDVYAYRFGKPANRQVAVLFRDITSRVHAQEALRESEDRYRNLFNSMEEGFCVLEVIFHDDGEARDLRVIEANPAFERQTGLQQAIGKRASELVPNVEQDWTALFGQVVKTGEPAHVENWSEALQRWFAVSAWRVGSTEDRRVAVVFADISMRKRSEERLAEARAQLERHNRDLETIVARRTLELRDTVAQLEAFSYSVVHDLRAPLRAMQGFARLLQNEFGSQIPAPAHDYLDRIVGSSQRMDQLIQDVLAFSSVARARLDLHPVNMRKLVDAILHSYPALDPVNGEIEIDGDLPVLLANEAALTQSIANLFENAFKFVSPDTRPHVRIWCEPTILPDGSPGARIYVRDNGIGIPPESQARIFEPFERLNENYPGTGIGLAIVAKAIERMGGKLGVQSEPGKGSTFWIELKRPPV